MKKPPDKHYVQFSKKIVMAVTAAVTLLCMVGLVLCAVIGDATGLVSVVKAYISYAIIVFAAYSGNSAVEKWLIKKYTTTDNDEQE